MTLKQGQFSSYVKQVWAIHVRIIYLFYVTYFVKFIWNKMETYTLNENSEPMEPID